MSTRTDPMATHRAAQQLRNLLVDIDEVGGNFECECSKGRVHEDDEIRVIAEKLADQLTVHFERRVNEHGVAVRNVVLRGPEEVDPNPPADALAEVRERLAARQPETVGASA